MQKAIADFLTRLSSRKFLVTIGGIVAVTLYPAHSSDIVTLIVTFIGAEGAGDVVSRYANEKTKQTRNQVQAASAEYADLGTPQIDRSALVSGADIPMQ